MSSATFEVQFALDHPPRTFRTHHVTVGLDHDGNPATEDAAIHEASVTAYHMTNGHKGIGGVTRVRLKHLEI